MSNSYYLLVDANHGEYLYYFGSQGMSPTPKGNTPEENVAAMKTFIEGAYRTALRGVTEDTLSDSTFPGYRRNLQGLGNQLHGLIPDKLKDATRGMAKGDSLHIYSTEQITIPWELIKNGGDFWGQLYVISNSASEGPARMEPKPWNLELKKVLNVIGYGVNKEVRSRAKKLFDDLHVQLDIIDGTDRDATSKFFELLPTADLIHFTGHGEIGPNGAYLRIVEAEDDYANFMVTSITSDDLRPGCIIFANACQSSGQKKVARRSIGFGPKFCECGASAFIGTLDLVPSQPAVLFAENFYSRLFSDDQVVGYQVGKALWSAKQLPSKHEGNPSLAPLLYSLYGNPLGTVKLPQQPTT
jgi:hypothetical protein